MQFRTELCDLLDIEYPLIQGAMAWIAGGKLAAAVSEAGGLGIIGTGDADRAWLQKQINIIRQNTSKPFGVNLMLTSPNTDDIVEEVINSKVPVVTTGGGNPGRYIEKLKDAGIKVLPVVASQALALRLTRLGADAVIAEGEESGGHIGQIATMCLVPMLVDVLDVPVIAAGGIADGRGLVAALALGAVGVQVGTRFICSPECDVHPLYQQKVLKARDRDTVVCGLSVSSPVRAIRNHFTREYQQAEAEGASKEVLNQMGKGRYRRAAQDGDIDEGTLLAGQISAMVKQIEPAGDIVRDIIKGAIEVKKRVEGIQCHE
ncbi:MAG: nitronate monooxygenase [Syntrophomonadaceae bacterium]|jgi:enoyl-[acyl-carrier protein] reductase II